MRQKLPQNLKIASEDIAQRQALGDLYNEISYHESSTSVHKQFAEVSNLSNLLLAGLIQTKSSTLLVSHISILETKTKTCSLSVLRTSIKSKVRHNLWNLFSRCSLASNQTFSIQKKNVFKSSEY